MKEFKFNIGDRVIAVESNELKRGVIKSLYTDLVNPMVIVAFDDGAVSKISATAITLEPESKAKEETEATEDVKAETETTSDTIPDDKTITISYGELRNVIVDLAFKLGRNNFSKTMNLTLFGGILAVKLFAPELCNE